MQTPTHNIRYVQIQAFWNVQYLAFHFLLAYEYILKVVHITWYETLLFQLRGKKWLCFSCRGSISVLYSYLFSLDTAICILTEVLQCFIVLYYYKNYMGSNIALMHFFVKNQQTQTQKPTFCDLYTKSMFCPDKKAGSHQGELN